MKVRGYKAQLDVLSARLLTFGDGGRHLCVYLCGFNL